MFNGLFSNHLDIIATDHAPHTIDEKNNSYLKAPSGGPLVQHSLLVMLEFFHQGKISLEQIANKMCHAPAEVFQLEQRGYIRKGYWADLVLIDLNNNYRVTKDNIYYKCGWSPFENYTFGSKIYQTYVNGNLVYDNGTFYETNKGMALTFNR